MPKSISQAEFDALCADSKILESSEEGKPMVLLDSQRNIIKLFPQKGLLSSDRFYPYAKRFINNSIKLRQLGFSDIQVEQYYYCRQQQCHIVCYPLIPGKTVLQLTTDDAAPDLNKLTAFIAQIHKQGVYFRPLHFDNVLLGEDGKYHLIDVLRCKFYKRAIALSQRIKTVRKILTSERNKPYFSHYTKHDFITSYLDATQLSPSLCNLFRDKIAKQIT